jgi:hypothetical protein
MLTNSSRQVNSLPFSFAADLVGESQRVDVELAKFDYPGEIIVAEEWLPECQCEQITVLDSPPPNHTDVADMISEVDKLFNGYRDRFASVVANLVMDSPETDKLVSLFRFNSAGDLSDLANVLDGKVISFLNELFGKPSGSSGNIDDWTSPHS